MCNAPRNDLALDEQRISIPLHSVAQRERGYRTLSVCHRAHSTLGIRNGAQTRQRASNENVRGEWLSVVIRSLAAHSQDRISHLASPIAFEQNAVGRTSARA